MTKHFNYNGLDPAFADLALAIKKEAAAVFNQYCSKAKAPAGAAALESIVYDLIDYHSQQITLNYQFAIDELQEAFDAADDEKDRLEELLDQSREDAYNLQLQLEKAQEQIELLESQIADCTCDL